MKGIIYRTVQSITLYMMLMHLLSCNQPSAVQEQEEVLFSNRVTPPVWAKDANIYEVNIRQYTPEGTFEAFRQHLPRLQKMGVEILWLMPIHPISVPKRKGTLGSYYAVSDFRAINPLFGNHDEFKQLVDSIHALDMHIIIDWVPHHTGWDHPWIQQHPEYYNTNDKGEIRDPINEETGEPWGWTDVAELNLSSKEMRRQIIDDMIYWIEEYNIDGFRVDHAHGVPDDYWDEVSRTISELKKPLFMLAEGEEDYLRNDSSFVVGYSWRFHHLTNDIARGEKNVNHLDSVLLHDRSRYTYGYNMYFTSNHDENSWAGTEFERMGEGHKAFAALCATIDGIPLLYSGQEEPLRKRLEFFEKDTIPFKNYAYADFYSTLLNLKKKNKALWNGQNGGLAERINVSEHVYAFEREKEGSRFVGIFNLSPNAMTTQLTVSVDNMFDVFDHQNINISVHDTIALEPWEFRLYSNK